jgi:hypothetical protein
VLHVEGCGECARCVEDDEVEITGREVSTSVDVR